MGMRTQREIENVLARGGVIGGSSAGATIQGSYLVRGAREGNETMMAKGYEEGFGYLRGVAIDQHLLVRGRQEDLVGVIEAKPGLLGLGLDEPTAIVVKGDRFLVIGDTVVGIYDGKDHDGKRYYFIKSGEQFDLRERRRVSGDFGLKLEAPEAAQQPTKPTGTGKAAIDAFIQAHADRSWTMAKQIWDWAELGYQEKRSSALLADALEDGRLPGRAGGRRHPDGVHRHRRIGRAGDRHPRRVRRPARPLAAGRPGPAGSARRHVRPRLRP